MVEAHKKELEKQLWNIANALRGNMSAEDEKTKAVNNICSNEKLDRRRLKALLDDIAYRRKLPLREDIFETMIDKLKLLERDTAYIRLNQVVSCNVDSCDARRV